MPSSHWSEYASDTEDYFMGLERWKITPKIILKNENDSFISFLLEQSFPLVSMMNLVLFFR